MDIVTQLSCLAVILDATTLRQLGQIVSTLLTMSGRVTMLGIARWGGKGTSYRTVQRFFQQTLPWGEISWQVFKRCLWQEGMEYLLVGDESVVTKAGSATHGVDRFFSSLYGKPVPGLAFLALALVSVEQARAYPLLVEQRVKAPPDPPSAAATPAAAVSEGPKRRGRPKGSGNKDKQQIVWNDELRLLARLLEQFKQVVGAWLGVRYLVLDGHFGHNNALQVAQQAGLQLVSKLRHDAALYLPYDGPYAGRGPRRKYGDRLKLTDLPPTLRQECTVDGQMQTEIYQAIVWHKAFAQCLKVVILVKTNLATQRRAQVILFSSDLDLSYERLIRFYQLRFQIEFAFRDAKQLWGLEDFMTVKATPVHNAAALSLFMVTLAHALLDQHRTTAPSASVLDLKAYFRGRFYATQTLNALPTPPEPIIFERILNRIATLGRIHPLPHLDSAA
jgi:putative transposase